jgi:hypothetical protein
LPEKKANVGEKIPAKVPTIRDVDKVGKKIETLFLAQSMMLINGGI